MKKAILLFLISIIMITFAFSAGCTSDSGPTQASPNEVSNSQTSPNQMTTTQASTIPQGDFSQVTHADVSTKQGHWTSGADADGIIVYPALEDVKGADVIWSGYTLPVDIQIYSTKFDASYNQVKDLLVYQGAGTISSWQDGNMFMGGGIQVPYSSMKVPTGQTYGWTYVTVHTPDGKTYSAVDKYTSLKP
jgi:hypothetical protein